MSAPPLMQLWRDTREAGLQPRLTQLYAHSSMSLSPRSVKSTLSSKSIVEGAFATPIHSIDSQNSCNAWS